jgi:hypothetical protein
MCCQQLSLVLYLSFEGRKDGIIIKILSFLCAHCVWMWRKKNEKKIIFGVCNGKQLKVMCNQVH